MTYLNQSINAASVEDGPIENYRFKGMLVGPSKGGKTTLSVTLPQKEGKPHLLIDTDNRWQSIAGTKGVEVLSVMDLASSQSIKPGMTVDDISTDSMVRAWSILNDINNELWLSARKGEHDFPYSSVISDGLSSLNRLALIFVLSLKEKADGTEMSYGLAGAPAKQHFGPQMHILSQLLFSLKALPCHYILTGHLELFEDKKKGTIFWLPRIIGNTRNEIGSWFDETWECESRPNNEKGTQTYIINTFGSGTRKFLGSSLNKQGKVWKPPVEFNLSESPCGIEKLISLRFGKKGDAPKEEKVSMLKTVKANQTKAN